MDNEKLRTALEEIAEGMWSAEIPLNEVISDMRAKARNALASDPEPRGVMGQIVPPGEGLDTEDGHW